MALTRSSPLSKQPRRDFPDCHLKNLRPTTFLPPTRRVHGTWLRQFRSPASYRRAHKVDSAGIYERHVAALCSAAERVNGCLRNYSEDDAAAEHRKTRSKNSTVDSLRFSRFTLNKGTGICYVGYVRLGRFLDAVGVQQVRPPAFLNPSLCYTRLTPRHPQTFVCLNIFCCLCCNDTFVLFRFSFASLTQLLVIMTEAVWNGRRRCTLIRCFQSVC